MKVTFEQVDSILKTLPTGYYLTRKADVQLTMGGETFAAVLDDKIFISYPTLALTLDRLPDDLDLETVEGCVRALLYHEVSHLFLSPTRLDMTKRVNVMEDERIETLLRKYYMKVNFKKFVILVNGGDGGDDRPENSFMAFYRLVRFRNYRWCAAKADERLAEVSRIIKDFADMGRTAGSYVCDRYVGRIDDLYKAVQRDMAEEEEKEKKAEEEKKDGEGKSDKSDGEGGDDSADSTGDSDGEKAGDKDSGKGKAGKDKKDSEGDKDGDDKAGKGSERSEGSADKEDGEEEGRDDAEGDGSDGEGDGDKEKEADGGDTGHTGAEGDKEGEKKDGSKSGKGGDEGDDESEGAGEGDGEGDSDKDTEKSRGGSPKGGRCGEPHDEDSEDDVDPTPDDATIDRKAVEELVTKLFSEYTMDVKTYARLERIFKAAEKKHSNHSAASNAYSGTLDPRQVAFRSDYRWWLHRNPQGEHRRFAKTHLTLFVDVSGSFSSSGQSVSAGQQVGTLGATGRATGTHCHFEVRVNGTPTDPLAFF